MAGEQSKIKAARNQHTKKALGKHQNKTTGNTTKTSDFHGGSFPVWTLFLRDGPV
jgi:hypothetical protein